MIRSIFSFPLIFFIGFFSNLLLASLPDEHRIIIEIDENNKNSYLNQAIQISALKILGDHETFVERKNFFNTLQSKDFISEFSSYDNEDKTFSKIIVDARSLRNFLVRNSFNVSTEASTSYIAWIFCDYDLNSSKKYKETQFKCDQLKKTLTKVSNERNAKIFFPFFDSEDLASFRSSNNDEDLSPLYLSNRYKADSFFYCYLSFSNEDCYLPDNILSGRNLNFSKKYDSNSALHKVIDGILNDRILKINSQDPEVFSIKIKNIKSFEDYKNVIREIEKIVIFSNIKTHSLSENELNLRTLLIGDFNQIKKLFNDFSRFNLEKANKESVTLFFN